ncbi:MAG: nucleotidyltransferase family protein [Candidatus Omnitrophica bacterium]|nr:nucleotidyltransferase family protein [Candidatus Omnitrophota bacterium]
MKILILAAGYATRLYPLTKHWPKPLLLVKEKPIMAHILEKVDTIEDVTEIIIVTNDKFFHQFKNWARVAGFKAKITVVNDQTTSEENRLGAIGDINFVINKCKIKEDLMVIGGDNLFSFNLKKFAEFVKQKKIMSAVGLYDIKNPEMVKNYGVVTVDESKKIIDFQEKPQTSNSTLISMCVYYFDASVLKLFKQYIELKDCHDTSGDYIKWLCKQTEVIGYEFNGVWYDIGDIVTFYHASVTFNG